MHELTLAMSLIDLVSEHLGNEPPEEVSSIDLEIGSLSGVDTEAMNLAFTIATKDTGLRLAKLNFHDTIGKGHCNSCDREFIMQSLLDLCPDCSNPASKIIQGSDLRLVSITLK
jgi:hydrogenase nickel incorporation protein HypA/HybF